MPPEQPRGWRTKTSNARAVEHGSRRAAEAALEDYRGRYRAGAASFRVVRLYDPDGGVRVIDFAREDRDAGKALREVERATADRDRVVQAAAERWQAAIARAVELGESVEAVAVAAGVTVREVRAVLRSRA